MRISLILFILTFISIESNAKEFPGYYVTMDNDTIHCQFKVQVNMFNNKLINQLSFRKKLKVIDKNGNIIKFKPHQIRMFQIDETSEGSEKYVPMTLEGKNYFVRELEVGKLNLYMYYYPHGYDGSVQMQYVLKYGDNAPKNISSGFWRKKFLKYMENDPWFMEHINETVKYNNIPELVINYNLEN